MSTEFPSKAGIKREWHLLDGENVVLGKLASHAAMLLMGKHKPTYTPFLDTGDHVIVLNAAKVRLTGKKDDNKLYRRFTGYPGGLVEVTARKMRATRPSRMVEQAIAGMLPKLSSASKCSGSCACMPVTSTHTSRKNRARDRSHSREVIECQQRWFNIWQRGAARLRWRGCFCDREKGRSTSTDGRSTHIFQPSRCVFRYGSRCWPPKPPTSSTF